MSTKDAYFLSLKRAGWRFSKKKKSLCRIYRAGFVLNRCGCGGADAVVRVLREAEARIRPGPPRSAGYKGGSGPPRRNGVRIIDRFSGAAQKQTRRQKPGREKTQTLPYDGAQQIQNQWASGHPVPREPNAPRLIGRQRHWPGTLCATWICVVGGGAGPGQDRKR